MKNLKYINRNMENEIKIKTEFDLNLKTEWEELEKKNQI